ncbi:hypothetical protein GWK47_036629 [Chionoecetes opilio]|uniref:Uncharacterized protein n=1 Tax=Chionoecetes opilio TaxID=41210 RepID=A0A8J4YT32_CHIOP|nr:hypothetical protein GWK47_036629 [Chionoecetes opilio]
MRQASVSACGSHEKSPGCCPSQGKPSDSWRKKSSSATNGSDCRHHIPRTGHYERTGESWENLRHRQCGPRLDARGGVAAEQRHCGSGGTLQCSRRLARNSPHHLSHSSLHSLPPHPGKKRMQPRLGESYDASWVKHQAVVKEDVRRAGGTQLRRETGRREAPSTHEGDLRPRRL